MIVFENAPSFWSLWTTLQGSIVPRIVKRVVCIDALAVLVCVLYLSLGWSFLDMTITPFAIIGLVVGIFLSFRNTVSYNRFWEARTHWGSCLITCRSLARQAIVFGANEPPEATQRRLYLLLAFAHALRHQLRGTDPRADLARFLDADTLAVVMASPHRPNQVLTFIGQAFYTLHSEQGLGAPLMASVEGLINELSHILGSCERIRSTPIPFAYLLLLHRTVHVYCYLLPFGLVSTVGWMSPIVVSFMAYAFLGLDALGDEISNPFADKPNALALDSICRSIEISLLAQLGEPVPEPIGPDAHGKVM
ncbi:MAG: bestrophin [Neisseriaceae bacterium]|nr:bestrophin [Neisseriaceae bacterium]